MQSILTAPVAPLILKIALPSMAAMIASSLASLFDALLLARQSAQLAAATSVGFSLLTLIQTLGFTLGMGAGSFVSRSLGRRDKPAAYAAASTALCLALALSMLLCAAGLAFVRPLAHLLGSTEAALNDSAAYARFVLLSGPFLCASLLLSSLLRAQGKTLPNMIAYLLGAALGVSLQFLLVSSLAWGVRGAGVAMLAREGATLLLLLFFTLREGRLVRPRLRAVSLTRHTFSDIMRSGLPTLLRQGLMSVSAILLTRQSRAFGEDALAGMGLCVRAAALVASAVIGFGQGFQPVCGYAFGAKDMQRVHQAYRFSMRCVLIALSLIGAAVFVFVRPLLSLISPAGGALLIAAAALRAQAAVFFAQGAVIMMTMLTQSMGQPIRASLVATSRQGFVFIPLALLLPRLFGLPGLILCQSASDVASLILCFFLTRSLWKDEKNLPLSREKQKLTGCACARGGCWGARTASR